VGVFGVSVFVIGAVSLALLIVRRGNKTVPTSADHVMLFLGIAGTITGLVVILLRFT
jgi:predicted membrane channel-forming protein YqfA (hemolysin III family)